MYYQHTTYVLCYAIYPDSTLSITQRAQHARGQHLTELARWHSNRIGISNSPTASNLPMWPPPLLLYHLSKLVMSSPVHDRRHSYPDNHIPFLFPMYAVFFLLVLELAWVLSWRNSVGNLHRWCRSNQNAPDLMQSSLRNDSADAFFQTKSSIRSPYILPTQHSAIKLTNYQIDARIKESPIELWRETHSSPKT